MTALHRCHNTITTGIDISTSEYPTYSAPKLLLTSLFYKKNTAYKLGSFSSFGVTSWIPKMQLCILQVRQFGLFMCKVVDTQNWTMYVRSWPVQLFWCNEVDTQNWTMYVSSWAVWIATVQRGGYPKLNYVCEKLVSLRCFIVARWIPKTELYMLEIRSFWVSTSLHQNNSNSSTSNICSSVLGIHLVTPKQLKLPNV